MSNGRAGVAARRRRWTVLLIESQTPAAPSTDQTIEHRDHGARCRRRSRAGTTSSSPTTGRCGISRSRARRGTRRGARLARSARGAAGAGDRRTGADRHDAAPVDRGPARSRPLRPAALPASLARPARPRRVGRRARRRAALRRLAPAGDRSAARGGVGSRGLLGRCAGGRRRSAPIRRWSARRAGCACRPGCPGACATGPARQALGHQPSLWRWSSEAGPRRTRTRPRRRRHRSRLLHPSPHRRFVGRRSVGPSAAPRRPPRPPRRASPRERATTATASPSLGVTNFTPMVVAAGRPEVCVDRAAHHLAALGDREDLVALDHDERADQAAAVLVGQRHRLDAEAAAGLVMR